MTDTLTCPNCHYEIEVSATLTAQVRDTLRKELDAEARQREAEFIEREAGLRQRELTLQTERRSMEAEVHNRVAQERSRLLEEAKSKAQESVGHEIRDLRDQLEQANLKLGMALDNEMQLRQERRDLEDEKRHLELTVSRKLDEERHKIREEAKLEADEEHRLKAADNDKLVADLRRQIDGLKRKAEQGSLQIQGEVMELELEELLRSHFPLDTIEPIPASCNGGDVVQHVHDAGALRCGTILWEAKRTKSFNDAWLPKLRDDLRAARGHVAVLVTAELPKGVTSFACINGVWVTGRACMLALAAALRLGIVEVARTRRHLEGKQTKIELLYDYLAGPEFRQRVEGIVEAFVTLRQDLESEKRSMRRIWNKREKQLDRAVANTTALYGDLGGILGPKLPQIPQLELETIAPDDEASLEAIIAEHELKDEPSPF